MTDLTLLPIPENLPAWKAREADRYRTKLQNDTHVDANGVLFWNSNNRTVPLDIFQNAYVATPAHQKATRDAELDAFLTEYKKQDHTPNDEQLFEMRAAFGPGTTVVNVITGKSYKV